MKDGGRPVSWKMGLIRFYYRIQKIVRDFFNFLMQCLSVYPWLFWNSLCSTNWPWTPKDSPVSLPLVCHNKFILHQICGRISILWRINIPREKLFRRLEIEVRGHRRFLKVPVISPAKKYAIFSYDRATHYNPPNKTLVKICLPDFGMN